MSTNAPVSDRPERCDMPDLGSLQRKVSLNLMLNRALVGGGPKAPRSFARIMNYVRIVDALLTDYIQMRLHLTEYVNTPNNVIYPLFAAISDAEECVTNLLRALLLAESIRRDKTGPRFEKSAYLPNEVTNSVRGFRNAIQHVDGALTDGTWEPPSATCLITKSDRISLYGNELIYSDLASWITALHTLSLRLAGYKEG